MVEELPGRVLAVDYGDARVGLALSEEMRFTVRPLETLRNRGVVAVCTAIGARVREHGVRLVLVGDPVNADDSVGPRAQITRRFAQRLAAELRRELADATPLILLWDESGSTEEALVQIRRRGSTGRRERRKGGIDRVAAAIILRDWLNAGAPLGVDSCP